MAKCKANKDKLKNLICICNNKLLQRYASFNRYCDYSVAARYFPYGNVQNSDKNKFIYKDEADIFGERCANAFRKLSVEQKILVKESIYKIFAQTRNNELSLNTRSTQSTDDDEDDVFDLQQNVESEDIIFDDFKIEETRTSDCCGKDGSNAEKSLDDEKPNAGDIVQQLQKQQQLAQSAGAEQTKKKRKSKSHACKICNKCFYSGADLRRHSQTHGEDRPFACTYCDAKFALQGNLTDHTRRHLGIKPNLCSYCGKAFTNVSELKVHTRTHTNEKPYICPICDKRFSKNHHCRNHIKTHSDNYEFNCSVCGKGFKRKDNMRKHEKGHFEVSGSYECGICSRKFRQQQTLTQHLKLHTGLKQYKCVHCDATFAQAPNLYAHRKKCKLQYQETDATGINESVTITP